MTPWDDLIALSRVTCPEGGWRPDAITAAINEALIHSELAQRETLGHSFERRPITLLKLGEGPRRVLLWSQMHGDEPTHTTALINLLGLLARGDAPAEILLSGLTLGIITPLNPDGAERCTRHNAQGIDINRDALAFATSEGRALRDAVKDFKPNYGFNLHNQPYRRGVGSPPEPCALTLLVPPIDAQDTQTESTREATRVAAFYAEAARGHCEGRLSRYQIDYMPRAFGEWVQRQGVSTLLVEASGWPGGDFVAPEKLHFAALVQTLETIAEAGLGDDSALGSADSKSYLDLPKSVIQGLHDLLITSQGITQSDRGELTQVDLAIDFPSRNAAQRDRIGGVLSALGDLHEDGGLNRIDAPSSIILPGRIALAAPVSEAMQAKAIDWELLLAHGVTTALVPIDLSEPKCIERIEELVQTPIPINAALVGVVKSSSDEAASLIAAGASDIVAVVVEGDDEITSRVCERFALPRLHASDLPVAYDLPVNTSEWVQETTSIACVIGWGDRGCITLGGAADLVVAKQGESLATDHLQKVLVGGTVARGEGYPRERAMPRWIV